MKLQLGRRYVTRDGQVTIPLRRSTRSYKAQFPFTGDIKGEPYTWKPFGSFRPNGGKSRLDLVEVLPGRMAGEHQPGDRITVEQLAKAPYGTVVRHRGIRYFKSVGGKGLDIVTRGAKQDGVWLDIAELREIHGWRTCTFLL